MVQELEIDNDGDYNDDEQEDCSKYQDKHGDLLLGGPAFKQEELIRLLEKLLNLKRLNIANSLYSILYLKHLQNINSSGYLLKIEKIVVYGQEDNAREQYQIPLLQTCLNYRSTISTRVALV